MRSIVRVFGLGLVLVLAITATAVTVARAVVDFPEPLYLVPLTFFPSLAYWAYNAAREG